MIPLRLWRTVLLILKKEKKNLQKTEKQAGLNVLVGAVPVKPCGQVQRNRDVQSSFGKSTWGGLRREGKRRKYMNG